MRRQTALYSPSYTRVPPINEVGVATATGGAGAGAVAVGSSTSSASLRERSLEGSEDKVDCGHPSACVRERSRVGYTSATRGARRRNAQGQVPHGHNGEGTRSNRDFQVSSSN